MQPEELDLTVQYYRLEHGTDATPSKSQDIFDDATRLVLSVTREVKWYTPSSSSLSFAIGEHCFQWNREVPELENDADVRSNRDIAEWEDDVAVGDDELWALAELEEFDHSRLHRLLEAQPPGHNHAPSADDPALLGDALTPPADPSTPPAANYSNMTVGQKRSPDRDFDALATHASKRPKLDESSTRDLIPQPHLFLSIATTDDPDYQPPSEVKLQWSPLPPHTLSSAMEYMQDPYTRLSWIIPVRGRLQWEGATTASILAPSDDAGSPVDDQLPCVNSDSSGGSELVWTRDALNDLWNTLKNVRESKRFGPLSLSYHVAMPPALASSMGQYSYIGSHKQTTLSMSSSATSNPSLDDPPSRITGSPLQAVDHIRVYHDAKYTQSLRMVLRVWSYKRAGQKVRLLKEAKLVLVDEYREGLMIC
ncbi:hypothetical protein K466DRAFT_486656 [Polyporus arcularius HHB13444]|uniref:Uncharacterized protein n=1 Tax=Polyporus arcularius HHB13444 TaxID=1314778 RepID=A0A5C3PMR7_9APHY|nr:hypothetical protein K466DRAFT_486656 [Polyporus arcularius HHB13444]